MIYHVRFVYLLTGSTCTPSDVTMSRPQKWHRIMSRYCQTSLIKDIVPAGVRILDITTVGKAFETLMRTTMGKLTIREVF